MALFDKIKRPHVSASERVVFMDVAIQHGVGGLVEGNLANSSTYQSQNHSHSFPMHKAVLRWCFGATTTGIATRWLFSLRIVRQHQRGAELHDLCVDSLMYLYFNIPLSKKSNLNRQGVSNEIS